MPHAGLSPQVLEMLTKIVPSGLGRWGQGKFYPCEVVTADGTLHPRVIVELRPSDGVIYRAADIHAETVTVARESPARLAPEFVRQLEDAGESGMGYTVFAVSFKRRWWRSSEKFFFVGESPFDFLPWPDGLTNANVISIHPHERPRDGHQAIRINTISVEYCVASGPPSSDG